ncbi:uncharacterized protein LAJ45_10105 [Morchella importuna]|uniref:uncharacterized protein n=1 Tax=Morchella importuna TaxID=1174673 RepID=UPI001E8D69F9|nr:uncharacterized protein LAJ45_10105 [Morchella importuna]KAH8145963.1 hypothetical protein LAJ45_10105 [Morchella importuna]
MIVPQSPPKIKQRLRVETNDAQRSKVITLFELGLTYSEIVERTGLKKTTCWNIVKRDKERRVPGCLTPYTASAPRSGRPEKLNRREKRYLISLAKRSRRMHLSSILTKSLTTKISMKTTRKYLKQGGLHKRRAKRKPFLSKTHKLRRMLWCKAHKHWTMEDWGEVIWTDESRFEVGFHGGTCWVCRAPGEEDMSECLLPTFKSGRTSVMIWASIQLGNKGPMVILPTGGLGGKQYVELIVEPALHPFYKERYRATHEAVVMENGAPPHRSKLAQAARNRLHIQKLPWPAQSPHLNLIENLWRIMKARINRRIPTITTGPALRQALQEEWDRFIPEDFRRLIESMPKRVKECLRNRGGSTHY